MIKSSQLSKVGALSVLALYTAFVEFKPAQAAQFGFDFGDSYNGGTGSLYFDTSPLKGVGTESISLSELAQGGSLIYFGYSYNGYNPLSDGVDIYNAYVTINSSLDDPTFTFESGNLVGIELLDAGSAGISGGTGKYGPPYYSSTGTLGLSFKGNTYETLLDYHTTVIDLVSVPIYDDDGNLINVVLQEKVIDEFDISSHPFTSGNINFTTIHPIVGVVPEPFTILGVGTALGFGSFFKRELRKKNK